MKSFGSVLIEVPSGLRLALLTPFGNSFVSTPIAGELWIVESIIDTRWLAVPFTWRREPHGALTAVDIRTFKRRAFFVEALDDE